MIQADNHLIVLLDLDDVPASALNYFTKSTAMRFDREIFKNYEQLYPPHLSNHEFDGCSKPVDVLYLDNTFLNRRFNFPPKDAVARMAVDFVK